MRTCTITANILQEPALYAALMYAMNSNTDFDGWHVMQYSEYRNIELKKAGEFMLREEIDLESIRESP